jgi:transcription elongation factor Elf1
MTDENDKPMVVFTEGEFDCLFCDQKITADAVDANGEGVTVMDCPECGKQHAFHDVCGSLAALLIAVQEANAREHLARLARMN